MPWSDAEVEAAALAIAGCASWDVLVIPAQTDPQRYREGVASVYRNQARRALLAVEMVRARSRKPVKRKPSKRKPSKLRRKKK